MSSKQSGMDVWLNIGMIIGISTCITILIFMILLILYNFLKNQPLLSIPWLSDNNDIKTKISTNISELQNQINKLSESSNIDINYVKNNTIPILEKSIDDLKITNTKSNKDIQTQIDKVNNLLISLQDSIKNVESSNKTELQTQIKSLSDNLQNIIISSQENTQNKLQKQIDDLKSLVNSENEEIKTKIIPIMQESISTLIDQKITQNTNEIILINLNKLKDNIQTQIDEKTLNIEEIKQIIKINLDNLKIKNETASIVINAYAKDGLITQWSIKGDENANLCVGYNKNTFCIDKNTGFLFNKTAELPTELPTESPTNTELFSI